MQKIYHEGRRYRVLLKGIEGDSPEKRETFSRHISEKYHVSFSLLRNILDRCPVILRKNMTLRKAETLTRTLKQYGGLISVEERRDSPPILLEYQETVPRLVALESSRFWKTEGGTWSVTGRVKNVSQTPLNDVWALLQVFENPEALLTFEEVPIAINPLPPGEASPFRALFEGNLPVRQVSIAFKNSLGAPLSAEDKRKKQEWAEVQIEDGNDPVSSSLSFLSEGGSQPFDIIESTEELLREPVLLIQESSLKNLETDIPSPVAEPHEMACHLMACHLMAGPREDMTSEDTPALGLEEPPSSVETKPAGEIADPPSLSTLPTPEKNKAEIRAVSTEGGQPPDQPSELLPGASFDPSLFQEATQLLKEIDQKSEQKEVGPPSFLWMEQFRDAVAGYYQESHDSFSAWFQSNLKGGGFENGLHSLVTLLAHGRFDQVGQGEKALENTQRVSPLIMRSNLSLDEMPSLEATQHFSAESWRNLFYNAIPRLHKIGRDIVAKETWDASELERLIQVIPHMSVEASRKVIRWMSELTMDVVKIDFFNTPVIIGDGLYRVATRLGVVIPHFDPYRDVKSMGYAKIQSFAKAAFPQDPVKIEEPMAALGTNGSGKGHCYPVQPRCERCLFENFCPRLHIPSARAEDGMSEDH